MKVAVIGAGAIGQSWAALFAAAGHQVVASDPRPEAGELLTAEVDRCWTALDSLGMVTDDGSPDLVSFTSSAVDAADGADFVQENAPEVLDLKHRLYSDLDAVLPADVVIASSSSGLTPSAIQTACSRHPERVLIGHPFNPPHLIPLVEVVGGSATSDEAIARAIDVYRRCGKAPIHIRAELPGHVTNRLQAALWREAYWLVDQGVASVADIDTAISSGPGLRWALLGPFATQHVSGGPEGIRHILEHLGPPMVEWWQSFETPEWTESLKTKVADGVDAELATTDTTAMLAERDRLLVDLLAAKADSHDLPGGTTT